MPGQVACSFFYIASHDGCHKQALEQELNMTTASGSRNTDLLSKGRPGRDAEGLELIKKDKDQDDGRRQTLSLTELGKDLAFSIKETIYS